MIAVLVIIKLLGIENMKEFITNNFIKLLNDSRGNCQSIQSERKDFDFEQATYECDKWDLLTKR
ncbi:hypothetical protein EBB07_17190 [Paenibacillaceae bacterium]|nr:hypothetical protein EBB07_17190 [Paenibacillaceae bacterium]